MNTSLVVLVVGVPLWYLLDYFGVRVLHEPKRSLTEAEYLDWHKGSTFASHILQGARNLLALSLFYSGLVLSMLDPQARPWFDGVSMLALVGAGLLAGATFRLVTARLTPSLRALVYLWRATPALFILLAVVNFAYPSWVFLPFSLLPVFVLVAEHVLRVSEEIFGRRWTLLPFEVPLCDHCDRADGVRAVAFVREDGVPCLAYLCPICAGRDPNELVAEEQAELTKQEEGE